MKTMPIDEMGGPVFPVTVTKTNENGGQDTIQYFGVSARDFFAAHAMQGMLASLKRWPDVHDVERVVTIAGLFADKMLVERKTK